MGIWTLPVGTSRILQVFRESKSRVDWSRTRQCTVVMPPTMVYRWVASVQPLTRHIGVNYRLCCIRSLFVSSFIPSLIKRLVRIFHSVLPLAPLRLDDAFPHTPSGCGPL